MSDDEVRGGYPVGGRRLERNGGLLPEDSKSFAVPALPVDLAAVQADDALLDALCGPNPSPEGSDARLTQVLMAWRREVDTEPMTPLVDTDTALAVVARARRPEPRRGSVLVPFAAAAAVLVIAFSGVGVGARAAEPGDRLWSLAKVLYTDHTDSVEAAVEVQAQLKQASDALAEGRTGDAQTALAQIEEQLQVVDDEESRAELEKKADQLRVKLGGRSGTDDRPGATSSSNSELEPERGDSRPSVESSTVQEAPTGEETSESLTEPEPSSPADPEPGTGETEGEDLTPTPRFAPPQQFPPPPEFAVPSPPARPGSSPPESSPAS